MKPGPAKRFDTDDALERARDVFWRRGYDGTSINELETALQIGRKSLYDTFGNKRELYLRALRQYTDTVVDKICRGLTDPRNGPMENLERVLDRLQRHHAAAGSRGCLLGVAMAQADSEDDELAKLLRSYLTRLERAFERTIRSAQGEGAIAADASAKHAARNLVAVTQGMALMGRITMSESHQRSIVRCALRGLRA